LRDILWSAPFGGAPIQKRGTRAARRKSRFQIHRSAQPIRQSAGPLGLKLATYLEIAHIGRSAFKRLQSATPALTQPND